MRTFFSSISSKIVGVVLLMSVVGAASAGPAVYAEIGGGGYFRDLKRNSVVGAQNKAASWDHGRMGWQAGFDAGYRFWKSVAGEVGFFWIQNQKLTYNSATTYSSMSFAKGGGINFQSWAMYLAGRFTVPVAVDWNVYAKLGLAFVRTSIDYTPTSSAAQSGSGSVWSPLFGLGFTYHFNQYWFVGVDYALFIGNSVTDDPYYSSKLASSSVHVPPLQRLTLNVGYLFEI
jgi:hypothetical protein